MGFTFLQCQPTTQGVNNMLLNDLIDIATLMGIPVAFIIVNVLLAKYLSTGD